MKDRTLKLLELPKKFVSNEHYLVVHGLKESKNKNAKMGIKIQSHINGNLNDKGNVIFVKNLREFIQKIKRCSGFGDKWDVNYGVYPGKGKSSSDISNGLRITHGVQCIVCESFLEEGDKGFELNKTLFIHEDCSQEFISEIQELISNHINNSEIVKQNL